MKYKFETHTHTAEISPCSKVGASDVVKQYHSKGYDGLVITDHVGGWSFDVMQGSWKDKVDSLIRAYDIAKNTGDKLGMSVLFGMEVALANPYRDHLVYGFDYDFLYKYEYMYEMERREFYQLAKEYDFLLVAAHPCRYDKNVMDAKYLDGVEVYNANRRQINNNESALAWAKKHNMMQLAGSDYHQIGDESTGIYLPRIPKTIKEFTQMLKAGEHKLILP